MCLGLGPVRLDCVHRIDELLGEGDLKRGDQPGVEEHLEMNMGDAPLVPARVDGLERGLAVGIGELDPTAESLTVVSFPGWRTPE